MLYTQNVDPSVTTQTFEFWIQPPLPPNPPLDLLMGVETYNIGVEGIGERGNKIMLLQVMFSINILHIYCVSHNRYLFLCNQSLP